MIAQNVPEPRHRTPEHMLAPAAVAALASAVSAETRLLEALAAVLRRQRQAVAADDLHGVGDSIFAVRRILITLGEARRWRRSINRLVCGSESLPLRELDAVLGGQVSDELCSAREGLHAAALTLSLEVEVNRTVVREALAVRRYSVGAPLPHDRI